jgi:hypothetical protein
MRRDDLQQQKSSLANAHQTGPQSFCKQLKVGFISKKKRRSGAFARESSFRMD